MSYGWVLFSVLILLTACASRTPAEHQTWKQVEEHMEAPEFMNRSR